MKRLIIISLTALFIASCGDGKTEIQKSKEAIDNYYATPSLKEHYGEYVVNGWHKVYEAVSSNEKLLKEHEEFILDKVAEAEAAKAIQEAGSN